MDPCLTPSVAALPVGLTFVLFIFITPLHGISNWQNIAKSKFHKSVFIIEKYITKWTKYGLDITIHSKDRNSVSINRFNIVAYSFQLFLKHIIVELFTL